MAEVRRVRKRFLLVPVLGLLVVLGGTGCASRKESKPARPEPPPIATPVTIKTVPPSTPAPVQAAPLPTRPLENREAQKAKKAGKPIGPAVIYAGVARADGKITESTEKKNGIPVFNNYVGSGFMLVIEGKPGLSGLEVGRRIFAYDPEDPGKRPDLEIQVDRDLGDGSEMVCDQRRPTIGGIPAIKPPSFAETKKIAATLNDMSCRFETFIESMGACTVNKYGDFSFVKKETTMQFCMVVARAWRFPLGDTLVSVRLRDSKGEPGPVSRFIVRRPKEMPTPRRQAKPTPQPTPPRRRP